MAKATGAFANLATIGITESAANTLTYKKLETGISLSAQVAWVIGRIEYFWDTSQFNSTADNLALALCASNTRSTIATLASLQDPVILDEVFFVRLDLGTAASGSIIASPYYRDFTGLPGGGLVVPPNPIYGAAQGSGLAAATTSTIRIYFTEIELEAAEFWSLVQARRIINA